MDWTRPLDGYCERLGPGLLAEPLNLITNLAFIAAGLAGAWLMIHRLAPSQRSISLWTLVTLAFAIGVGSALFHSFANVWSAFADSAPIALYLLFYVGVLTRELLGQTWPFAIGAIATLLGLSALFSIAIPRAWVHGSNSYFGAAAMLFVIASVLRTSHALPAKHYAAAGVVFLCSLTFRTLDMPLCGPWPAGTHFLWHLCNGTVIFLTLRAAILLRAETTSSPALSPPSATGALS